MKLLLLILGIIHTQKIADAFLWVFFTGNTPDLEQIYFAISTNGFDFTALNKGNPIINSSLIADQKAIRDPHIYRGPDDDTYYMVATDLSWTTIQSGNQGIVMLKSKDLITWTSTQCNIAKAFPEKFGDIDRVWAPQTIYDEKEKKLMVYLTMHHAGDPNLSNVIYYSYANEDFTGLSQEPQQLYHAPNEDSCIDGDIIQFNGQFYLFHKDETRDYKVFRAVSDNLLGPYTLQNATTVQNTTDSAEGSCIYPLGDGTYVLMYDIPYSGHQRYELETTTDMITFTLAKGTQDFVARHGTVMQITTEEMDRLIQKWG